MVGVGDEVRTSIRGDLGSLTDTEKFVLNKKA
jgi:hypothetical protein